MSGLFCCLKMNIFSKTKRDCSFFDLNFMVKTIDFISR